MDFVVLDSTKIYRRTLSRPRTRHGPAVRLDPSNTNLLRYGEQLELVALRDATGSERAGDDGAETLYRETAVYRKTWFELVVFTADTSGCLDQSAFQIRYTVTGPGTDGKDRRALEERSVHELRDIQLRELERFFVGEIGFR